LHWSKLMKYEKHRGLRIDSRLRDKDDAIVPGKVDLQHLLTGVLLGG
jgi:hypothetical protein